MTTPGNFNSESRMSHGSATASPSHQRDAFLFSSRRAGMWNGGREATRASRHTEDMDTGGQTHLVAASHDLRAHWGSLGSHAPSPTKKLLFVGKRDQSGPQGASGTPPLDTHSGEEGGGGHGQGRMCAGQAEIRGFPKMWVSGNG